MCYTSIYPGAKIYRNSLFCKGATVYRACPPFSLWNNVILNSKGHSFFFFPYLGFLLRTFTIHRTPGEGEGYFYFFKFSLPLPPVSQAFRHQSGDYCTQHRGSPLHIASSRTRTWNLWFPSASR